MGLGRRRQCWCWTLLSKLTGFFPRLVARWCQEERALHGLWDRPPAKPNERLYIIGLGIKIPGHTTAEAAQAMGRCNRLYSIVQEPPRVWLPSAGIEVVNLLSMYAEGALRIDNYERAAARILGALQDVSTVGYVTYGSPLAYDSVAQHLVFAAKAAGIPFEVISGISSIDTLLCDLGLDMAPGIQIYEASWLVTHRAVLNLSIPVVLVQMREFGSFRTHYRERRPASALQDLVNYLCSFYPATHEGYMVQSSNQQFPSLVRPVPLGRLCELEERDFLPSFYIPILQRTQPDTVAVEKMKSS
jgi:uncharacterized protein YabN with tetrapyrrole methylase and pyrophosphatase domain